MDVLLVVGAIAGLGYIMKNSQPEPTEQIETPKVVANVYNSNAVKQIQEKEQAIADSRYITGSVGTPQRLLETLGDVSGARQTFNENRRDPGLKKNTVIEERNNTFVSAYSDDTATTSEFSNVPQLRSKYNDQEIVHDATVMPFSKKDIHEVRERYTPTLPENYARKKEVASFTDPLFTQNVYSGTLYDVSKNRFHNSRLQNGEKPFEPVMLAAPKVGTDEAPTFKYKTLDELVVVNVKESYKGRIVEGTMKSAETRGIQPAAPRNGPETFTEKTLSVPTSFIQGASMVQDFATTFKDTTKQSLSESTYKSPAHSVAVYTQPTPKTFTDNIKTSSEGVFGVNIMNANLSTGDYGKDSYNPNLTQRNTTRNAPIGNANMDSINLTLHPDTAPRSTVKESTTTSASIINAVGETSFSRSEAVDLGVAGNTAKTTMKEQNLFGHVGAAKASVDGGYVPKKFKSGGSFKEIIANRSQYTGAAGMSQFSGPSTKGKGVLNENKLLAETTHRQGNPAFASQELNKSMIGESSVVTAREANQQPYRW